MRPIYFSMSIQRIYLLQASYYIQLEPQNSCTTSNTLRKRNKNKSWSENKIAKLQAKLKQNEKNLEEKSKIYLSNIEKDQEEIMSNAHNIVLDNLNSKTIYGYEDQKTLLFGK